jgi:anti-anti-sigma factor
MHGDTLVVVALGDVSTLVGPAANAEVNEIISLVEQRKLKNIVIDLDRAEYFGTLMLELLNSLWRAAQSHHGKMALCSVSELGREILGVSRLDHLWEILPSREGAMEAVADHTGKSSQV